MVHDQRLKTLIQEFFPEFLQLFFSEWLDLIDFSEIEWLEQEVNTNPPDGPRYLLDIVAKVRSREAILPWHLGESEPFLLAVLLEIESPDSTRSIRERMPWYSRHLRDKLRMPVLPITLFLRVGMEGVGKLIHKEQIRDLVTDYSESLYVGLPHFDGVEYAKGHNWLGVALSAWMKIPSDKVVSMGAKALRRIARAPLDPNKKFLLAEFMQAYLPFNEGQKREFKELIQTKAYFEVKAMNVTYFDEVRMQGQIEGEVNGLILAIKVKFGHVSETIEKRIRAISTLEEVSRAKEILMQSRTLRGFLRELKAV